MKAVEVIRDSSVRLTGSARVRAERSSRDRDLRSSRIWIVTNAHVVAGVEDLVVRVRPTVCAARHGGLLRSGRGHRLGANPEKLQARPVENARTSLESQDPAVVAGFPGGERFEAASVGANTSDRAR